VSSNAVHAVFLAEWTGSALHGKVYKKGSIWRPASAGKCLIQIRKALGGWPIAALNMAVKALSLA